MKFFSVKLVEHFLDSVNKKFSSIVYHKRCHLSINGCENWD